MTAAWCPPESLPMLWNFLKSQTRTLSAAAEKRLRPLGLSAMSVTAVSPVGMAKVRLAETNWTGPFVVRPLDDKVFTHVVLLILKSHTFIKAEDTVKAILVASEYLTQTYGLHKYNNIYFFFFINLSFFFSIFKNKSVLLIICQFIDDISLYLAPKCHKLREKKFRPKKKFQAAINWNCLQIFFVKIDFTEKCNNIPRYWDDLRGCRLPLSYINPTLWPFGLWMHWTAIHLSRRHLVQPWHGLQPH